MRESEAEISDFRVGQVTVAFATNRSTILDEHKQ